MILVLLLVLPPLRAQTIHLQTLNPDLELRETRDVKVYDYSNSLLKSQLDFQQKVFRNPEISKKS